MNPIIELNQMNSTQLGMGYAGNTNELRSYASHFNLRCAQSWAKLNWQIIVHFRRKEYVLFL